MLQTTKVPVFQDVRDAQRRISGYANRTPVLTSQTIDSQTGSSVFFKCENFQKVGAFKFRGACNAVFSLPDEDAQKGVGTHSSGNHAQALALAARLREIPAYVVMPENAPRVKVEAVKNYGAEVTFCASSLESREQTLEQVLKRTGAVPIHPYNDARIIAGQGTAAVELLEDYPELDIILTPVGGGGLLSGTALAAKSVKPGIRIIGTEPEMADDAFRSFKEGKLLPDYSTETIADGLRTSLGELPFEIIREQVDDIVTVSEESIIRAMRYIWERMNIIIEASCAVPVAALLEGKIEAEGKKTGIIITGGNTDLDNLPWQKTG